MTNVSEIQRPTLITAESILAVDDLGHESIYIEEWGSNVYVRGLTAGERAEVADMFTQEVLPTDAQARLAVMGIVDADGRNLFSAEHVDRLAGKSAGAIATIAEAVMRISGLAATPEEAEKN